LPVFADFKPAESEEGERRGHWVGGGEAGQVVTFSERFLNDDL
jgi:hypothetical protein